MLSLQKSDLSMVKEISLLTLTSILTAMTAAQSSSRGIEVPFSGASLALEHTNAQCRWPWSLVNLK